MLAAQGESCLFSAAMVENARTICEKNFEPASSVLTAQKKGRKIRGCQPVSQAIHMQQHSNQSR